MVGRCTRLTVCSLVALRGAQERGTLRSSVFTIATRRDHVSRWGGSRNLSGLHYADTPESAASIAAYLKGLAQAAQARPDEAAKKRPTHSRRTKHRGEANPANP